MARDFDGTDDRLDMGTDASIDGFTTKSMSWWVERDVGGVIHHLLGKDRNNAQWQCQYNAADQIRLSQDFDGATNGIWISDTTYAVGSRIHVAIVYDGGLTTNDPSIYVNGTAVAITESTTPAGALVSDAASSLLAGEAGSGLLDFDGRLGWINYVNALWSAAQVNRARWWGSPGGAQAVYHPLVTDKLTNEGTATANISATGTTVVNLAVPVVRPGTALMGMGVGW